MTHQVRNPQLIDLISQDVPLRAESAFAWKSVIASYQAVPCLRGFWPTSAMDGDGDCLDFSGNGLTLSNNGNLVYDHRDLAPIVDMDGTGDYLSHAGSTALNVTGTEAYVAMPGLSCGLWIKSHAVNLGAGLMSKFLDNIAERSYLIVIDGATSEYKGFISSDGTAANSVGVGTGIAHTQDAWTSLALRFDPGNELKLWVNLSTYTQATALAQVHSSPNTPLYIGRRDTGAVQIDFDGQASLAWIAAANLPDYIFTSLYEYSRRMFNV